MPEAKKAAITEQHVDENLAQARLLWSLGDWQGVGALSKAVDDQPGNELSLFVVAAWYQLGQTVEAEALLRKLTLNSADKLVAAKLLVSGVFNALAKAAACSFEHDNAEALFSSALHCALPTPVSTTLLNARATEQMAQLGLPRFADNIAPAQFSPDTEYHLAQACALFNNEPAMQVAFAEHYQLLQQFDQAIVHWQNVSSMLNADTPQLYYERLKEAYKSVKSFPTGTIAQETLTGDTDKHTLLAQIHATLKPQFYFEIGVQTGKSLALASCDAMGVDPMPLISAKLGPNAKVITASSDAFFARQSDVLMGKSVDFSFIDGMHLFEYVLRDFINVERHAKPHTLIVIDDIFPGHADQAKRERCTRAWTGDVWKLKVVLEKYRPDLATVAVDAHPTGLLLITALDPDNTYLQDNYQAIVDEYIGVTNVPDTLLSRSGAISGKDTLIKSMVELLVTAKKDQAQAPDIKTNFKHLVS